MVKSSAVAAAAVVPKKKVVARVALATLDEAAAAVLRECFKQFGIQIVNLSGDVAARLHREKFEACVVQLANAEAESVLNATRTSPSNSRIVIYGICSSAQETLRFSKYCINAVFHAPVERQAALKVVRATHLLVVHELRRYVRLPVVTEVDVKSAGDRCSATSQEISAGGMSMKASAKFKKEQPVEVTFCLPDMTEPICIKATVCWRREADHLVGVRFDRTDEERLHVKRWIDNYLEIG